MELNTFFTSSCRKLDTVISSSQLSFRKIVSGKKGKNQNGEACKFAFDDFNLLIYYIERGKTAYAQQTLWLGLSIDNEPDLVFSIYDVLAFVEPENFNCYTYTYVDSQQLMAECFCEIEKLFSQIIPELKLVFENGVLKNKLIETQKNNINNYFGDKILEANEMLGGVADKLISMMLSNFFEYQIECAVVGAQSLFYSGKTEKALKALKKAKARSAYEEQLLSYIEKGGKAPVRTETAKKASAEKGSKRHKTGFSGGLKTFGLTLFIDILFSLVVGLLFYLVVTIKYSGALYVMGITENLLMVFVISLLPSALIALKLSRKLIKNRNKKENIKTPKATEASKTFTKYLTIAIETIFVIQFITCINSTTVLNDKSFCYSVGDFPLTQSICDYDSIEFAAIITENESDKLLYPDEKYIVFYTKSGTIIDLYNSTFLSVEEIKVDISQILEGKNIPVKEYKNIDMLLAENR